MSWEIKLDGETDVVVLAGEMGIQSAAEFHQAVLPLAGSSRAVRLDAAAAKSVHTSILQILHALSQAVDDFAVTDASDEFRAAERRVGLYFARTGQTGDQVHGTGETAQR